MDTAKKQLARAEGELATGRKVLKQETKKLEKLKKRKAGHLHRENAKRALRTIETGVEALEERRDVLTEKAKQEKSGNE
jgi:hypothetical protein